MFRIFQCSAGGVAGVIYMIQRTQFRLDSIPNA